MTLDELDKAIQAKAAEIEIVIEAGRPQEELLPIYKELKELHFQKVQAEMDGLQFKKTI